MYFKNVFATKHPYSWPGKRISVYLTALMALGGGGQKAEQGQ
jgi:hypothetical protein